MPHLLRKPVTAKVLPNGGFAGTAHDALDCACGLSLNEPTA